MPPRVRISKTTADAPEPDRVEGFPHPRETFRFVGQGQALVRASRVIRGGYPPQAWLITGPPGVGKATLAYRIARYALAHGATSEGAEDLSVSEREANAAQIAAGSHPGLLVLKRGLNDSGKMMSETSVHVVRKLSGFFGMTSAAGGWRIAIVDTADDMNDAAANALLKMLEEPPPRAMLLLLSNVPGRLLPTIRSRCQRLDLRPLDANALEEELARLLPDMPTAERTSLARLASGSLGMALQLAGGDGVALARDADNLLDCAAAPDIAAILALGDRVARITDGLPNLGEFLIEALMTRIRARAFEGRGRLDRWVECLNRLNAGFTRTSALNLEPRQTLLSAAGQLAAATKRAGAL
ncbi:MAG TPA: DNA polymerase III subunit delta' [Rhizomicrobium sp.]|nr:DNA polymerase III subunit delta' [Rhizomicrobium sp.]